MAELPDPARLTHRPLDCPYAIEAGGRVFASRMKALLLRAVVLARWPPAARSLAGSAPIGAPTCSQACAPSSAPPHAAAWAPTRLSSKPCAGRPSLTRVEQLPAEPRLMASAPPFDDLLNGFTRTAR